MSQNLKKIGFLSFDNFTEKRKSSHKLRLFGFMTLKRVLLLGTSMK
ncbi:hypothetical protein LEP1GSC168_3723 [Leptospira santarosai str. HAI134]|nr:hypothetical protein LEP1GSC168_3723 [Leptospira santarosai str. HAI134]